MNAVSATALPCRRRLVRWTMACLLGLLGMPGPLRAFDCYLKLEGIPGEITTGPMTGWSQLSGMSAGVMVPPTVPPDPPPPPVLTLAVSKPVGAISPQMAVRCASGDVIPRLSLICRNGAIPLLRVTLQDVRVVGCGVGGTSEPPTEQISFTFQKIEWSYFYQEGSGGGKTGIYDAEKRAGSTKLLLPYRAVLENRPGIPGLLLTCPVEAGHRYRVASAASPAGPWNPGPEFTAAADGVMQQTINILELRLFLRVEELD